MIVIRPISEAEAPAFLALLCRVFNLDPARAEGIFFSEPFFDLDRKWALFEGGRMRSILTTVPLVFGDGPAYGIAGVGTDPAHQGRGFGERLLRGVLNHGRDSGEERALLFAHRAELYERCGFTALDHVVRAPLRPEAVDNDAPLLPFDEVESIYEQWASGAANRLQRPPRRWQFWKWNLRICSEVPGGYVCQEGDTVRECIFDVPLGKWPVYTGAEWFGLRCLAEELQVPLGEAKEELIYMGYGFTSPPRMFMTDQF